MTTLTARPNTLHASLIEALAGAQPERALEQAFLQLGAGANLPLLLAMLKALVRLGLAGIATELLRVGSGALRAQPQLTELADQLASLPSGEVDAARLEETYAANWAALDASQPRVAADLSVAVRGEAHEAFSIFRSTTKNLYMLRRGNANSLEFVFPLGDQRAQLDSMNLPPATLTTSILLIGVPSPILWRRLLGLHAAGGYLPPITVIEPDIEVLKLWLCLVDSAGAFRSGRAIVFGGERATERCAEFFVDHPCRGLPSHFVTNWRPRWRPPPLDRQFHARVAGLIESQRQAAMAQLQERYAPKIASFWRERFRAALSGGPPLRVAAFTNRFSTVIQHSMRHLADAMRRRGCQAELVMQPDAHSCGVDVAETLANIDFDMIAVIDHLRSECSQAIPANVPYVCWIQDSMPQLCSGEAGRSVGRLDLVIGHAPHLMAALHGYPTECFIASNNLTDPYTYSDEPLAEAELAPHRCDLSYVSHGSKTPQQLVDEIAQGSIPQFRQLLMRFHELAIERLESTGWINAHDLLALMLQTESESEHPPLTPRVRRSRVHPQIARLYDRIFRHQALEWAAEWGRTRGRRLKLYGRGWHEHPTLGRYAAGEIAPGHPLRCLYQASTINLQLNGYGALHQRLLDGVASGGLVLSRCVPGDYVRRPLAELQRAMRHHGICTFKQLLDLIDRSGEAKGAAAELARLSGLCLAPCDNPRRMAMSRVIVETGGASEALDDDGLFAIVDEGRLLPARTAADLPEFDRTAFSTRDQMHELLDRYVDGPQLRSSIVQSMRQNIMAHDTYDALTQRIFDHFANLPC